MSRVVAAISGDPDRGVIRNFSQGSGAVSRVIVGFLFRFELAVRLAEITEVWPLWFEGIGCLGKVRTNLSSHQQLGWR